MRRRLEVLFLLGAIVWAGFEAWQDQYATTRAVTAQLNTAQSAQAKHKALSDDHQTEIENLRKQLDATNAEFAKAQDVLTAANARIAILPRDRSQTIATLQKFYSAGSAIEGDLRSRAVSDAEIAQAETLTNAWLTETASWIYQNMSPAAAARFTNNSDKNSHTAADFGPIV